MKTHLMILLAIVVALFAAAPVAQAQCDGCYGGGGWDYGMGYLYGSLDYNVPYFAAHPPVYYSYPVPRTYGYSPFAYPPNVMTPEIEMSAAPQPVEIINPYVPSSQQTEAKADQSAAAEPRTNRQPEPLVIINPYVAGAGSIARNSE